MSIELNHNKQRTIRVKSLVDDYLELTKPRITLLVLVTAVIGYYLGARGIPSVPKLIFLLIGVGLTCGGSGALNHFMEREYDALMDRTKNRPIPMKRISPSHAFAFGVLLIVVGIFLLYVEVNILTAFLSLVTTFMYLLIYTPMKKVSWLNTSIGAFPGAMAPLGGWAAATGTLSFDAGILFLILFVWQHPHFYAIAWLCKDDYKKGGFKMLPVIEPDGNSMFHQILFYSAILIPVSLMPALTGLSGAIYLVGALILGIFLLKVSYTFSQSRSLVDARKLLRATVIYLPLLLTLIIIDLHF